MLIQALQIGRFQLGKRIHALNVGQHYSDKQDKSASDEFALLASLLEYQRHNSVRILEGPEFLKYRSGNNVQASVIFEIDFSKIKESKDEENFIFIGDQQKIDVSHCETTQQIVDQINNKSSLIQSVVLDDTRIGVLAKKPGTEGNNLQIKSELFGDGCEKTLEGGSYGGLHKYSVIKHVVETTDEPVLLDSGLSGINTVDIQSLEKEGDIYTINSTLQHCFRIVDNRYILLYPSSKTKLNTILTLTLTK